MRKLSLVALVLSTALVFACRGDDDDPPTPDTDGGVVGDGPITNQEGGGSGTEATIEQVKTEVHGDGTLVLLKDVVVTAVDGYGQYTDDVYVQDSETSGPNKGIKLFINSRVDGGQISDLKPGDHVKVEGTVTHWTGPTSSPFKDGKYVIELKNNKITKLGPGGALVPAELTVDQVTKDPDGAKWEGSLITVKDVKVLTLPDTKYGDFDVTGNLAVDDELYGHSPTVGDCITVTGVSVFFYQYNICPRSSQDVAASTGCVPAKSVTIKDIQDETSANHPTKGDEVKVTGVITAVDANPSSSGYFRAFFIQDGTGPYSGLQIYHSWDSSASQKPQVGEEVEVTGIYDEYYDLSELKNVTWTVKGTKTVPTPEAVAAADIATSGSKGEEYEGVLVEISGFKVDEIVKDKSGNGVAVKDNTTGMLLDYELFDFFASDPPTVGTTYTTVKGALTYSFDDFRILPRDAADMVK